MARLTIEMSAKDHAMIKMMAAAEGLTLRDWFFKRIGKKPVKANPKKEKIPNRLTRKVMRDTDRGLNLTAYESVEAMLKSLGYKPK